MKIDVSDLFDDLYQVAIFARNQFNRSQQPSEASWQGFCESLSDTLFLPACAARAHSLTHIHASGSEVKPRIITERMPPSGTSIFYCRYTSPSFVGGPQFGVTDGAFGFRLCTRPKDKLMMWLGKLPPDKLVRVPPSYPRDLDTPIRYYAHQHYAFSDNSPFTRYYELHGDWCLRRIEQRGMSVQRESPGGEWMRIDDLAEIPKPVFEAIWEGVIDTG